MATQSGGGALVDDAEDAYRHVYLLGYKDLTAKQRKSKARRLADLCWRVGD